MVTQAYPPTSGLKAVKKMRVDVELQGQPPALIDKLIKQVVSGIVGTANSGVEIIYGESTNTSALLHCTVAATASMTDDDDRPLGMAYVLRLDLLTALPSHPEDELFNVWSEMAFGHIDTASLMSTLMDWAKTGAYKLVESLEASRD